jgi:GAF domain-containing protein
VPVFDAAGELLAVFDVDSDRRATFDDDDRAGLERILAWFSSDAAGRVRRAG